MIIMKKYLAIILALVLALSVCTAFAEDAGHTLVDWSGATDADINGGALASGFADLSYWNTPSEGTQSVKNGMFTIDIAGNNNCYQFGMSSAFNDVNKPQWAQYDMLRIYMENNTQEDFSMTLYLYIDDASSDYGAAQPMTNGLGVYLIYADEPDEIYEPDYRYDNNFANRYYYIPSGFKGYVMVPSTFARELGDDLVGWLPSYWANPETLDYSIPDMEKAAGLSFDIRADGITGGQICIGNLELVNEGADIPAVTDKPSQPAVTDEVTEPAVTDEVTEPAATDEVTEPAVTDGATEDPTEPAQGEFPWIIVAIAAVVVVAGVVVGVVVAKKNKKQAN